jgi:hypothetical protein
MKTGHTDLAYKVNTAVDLETGLIVAAGASTADLNDRQDLLPWVDQAREHLATVDCQPQVVVTDSGYHSGENLAELDARGVASLVRSPVYRTSCPAFPLTVFTYEAATDTYTCPAGVVLMRQPRAEARAGDGRRVYQAQGRFCRACPHFGACTKSKQGRSLTLRAYAAEREANLQRCRTPAGRLLRGMRHARGESPFHYFKAYGGLRRLCGHGLAYAHKRVVVAAIGWNLLRLLHRLGDAARAGRLAACLAVVASRWRGFWPIRRCQPPTPARMAA